MAAPRGSVLEFRDQVQEDTIIVKVQIGQIVGEVGEVIADTDFGIVSDMTIERGQNAGALVISLITSGYVLQAQHPTSSQSECLRG